jgi:hypothetical protein
VGESGQAEAGKDAVDGRGHQSEQMRNAGRAPPARSGSVVTWRRAQIVLLSAQGMPVAKIAEVTFTVPDRPLRMIRSKRLPSASSIPRTRTRSAT